MAPTNKSIQDAMENILSTCAILPPKPVPEDFELFQALQVTLGNDGRAEFTPFGLGIDERFLREYGMNEHIEALKGFIAGAETIRIERDIHQGGHLATKFAGNMEVNENELFNAKVDNGRSSKSRYDYLTVKRMKRKGISQTANVKKFLEDCVPAFCNDSSVIRAGFQRNHESFRFWV